MDCNGAFMETRAVGVHSVNVTGKCFFMVFPPFSTWFLKVLHTKAKWSYGVQKSKTRVNPLNFWICAYLCLPNIWQISQPYCNHGGRFCPPFTAGPPNFFTFQYHCIKVISGKKDSRVFIWPGFRFLYAIRSFCFTASFSQIFAFHLNSKPICD